MPQSLRQDVGDALSVLRRGTSSSPVGLAELAWLRGYVAPHRARVIAAAALLAIVALLGAVLPLAVMFVVDRIVPSRDLTALAGIVLGLVAIQIVRPFLSFLASYQFTVLGQSVQVSIREELFRHLLRLPLAFFEKSQSSYLAARLGEVNAVSVLFSSAMILPFLSLLEFVWGIVVMSYISWRLTLIVSLLLPMFYILARLQSRGLRAATRSVMEQGAVVSQHLQESLSGVQTIKEHGAEERESQKIAASLERLLRSGIVQSVANAMANESVGTFTALAGVLVLWLGARAMIDGSLTVGSYIAFSAYMVKVVMPMQMLATLSFGLQPAFAGVKRLSELLEQVTEGADHDRPPLDRIEGQIVFEAVHFAHEDEGRTVEAIRGASFAIGPGERVALVGPSGSGKTTLVRLLLGLYRPTAGTIRVDGRDLAEVRLGDLRDRIGIVSQNVFLFNDTIHNNIRYSRPDADAQEVMAAAAAADADGFIRQLPGGYETVVGERGTRLSGGQMQRLSIARALLKKPDVVIFDEATSQLDGESERRVWREAETLLGSCTRIIISHRLNPVLTADRVIVLDAGRVVASGRHAELLAREPRYRQMFVAAGVAV